MSIPATDTAVSLHELTDSLNELLRPRDFRDYCPNGLQVEGRPQVRKVVSGVTASQALIDAAIEAQADALLVHHGYFWQGEDPTLTGIKQKRVASLLAHGISLLAYHLPLDDHAELGNNAQLGRVLGFSVEGEMEPRFRSKVGVWGQLDEPMDGDALAAHIADRLGRKPLYIPGTAKPIRTIAWCTGGAQNYIDKALACGVDAYLTGEVSEQTVHFARETGLHFFAAGHHATERYGAPAVGNWLAERFGIVHEFIDIDNPA